MIPISNIARLRSRLATTLGAGLVLVVAGGACASTPASDPGRIAAHRATLSAIGAVAGLVLPFISWPIGLAAGAGFALYQRIKK